MDYYKSLSLRPIRSRRLATNAESLMGQAIYSLRLHHLRLASAAVIVVFHRVNNVATLDDGLSCSVKMFERHCRFFRRYFQVVSLRSLVEKLERGIPANRELVITFDDGYRDNLEYAAPVLKAMGLPATFFVVTQFIGKEIVPWWDKALGARHAWMNWNEVRSLRDGGFEVGNHTRTHADLGTVSGNEAWEEIHRARLELEDQLSAPIDLFAYPYGGKNHMTEANRAAVRAAGLRCCCSCFGGINFKGTHPFHLRRTAIFPWYESPHQFGFELAFSRA